MSSEDPFMRGYNRGLALKRQSEQDALDAEDRKANIEIKKAQLKIQDIEHKQKLKQAQQAEQMQYYNLVKGTPAPTSLDRGGGITTPALQTQGAPVPSDFSGTMGATPAPQVTTPLQHPPVTFDFGGKKVDLRPPTDVQEETKAMKEYLLKAKLEQIKNTVTVKDPTTGQDITGPKDLVDNIMTQTGAAAGRKETQAATAALHQSDREAADARDEANRKSREAIAAANRASADARAKNTQTAKPPTEGERRSFAYYTRLAGAKDLIDSMESEITKLDTIGQVRLRHAPNIAQSQLGQKYNTASADFINAALRQESGAAIQQSEYARFNQIYFPQPGDTAETLKQKKSSRDLILKSFKAQAGRAYQETYGEDAPKTAPASGGWKIISVK